jgi:hypothetical protein
LPLYVNAALRDPFKGAPGTYESGGPTDNVLNIWKAEAPAIDILAPDIYMSDTAAYLKVLDLYHRPDNALFIPETSGTPFVRPLLFLRPRPSGHRLLAFRPGLHAKPFRRQPGDPDPPECVP